MKKNKKISKSFIGFLVASIFIWLLIAMSKEYVTIIKLPIAYNNIPQDKLLQNQPQKEIELVLKASGFKIIRTKFKKKTIALNANELNKKTLGNYYLLIKNQLFDIQSQLLQGVELQEIPQDTLFLKLGSLKSKKVPVISDVDITFKVGYDMSKKLTLVPDSVLISGPELKIDSISNIKLNRLTLKGVKNSFSKEVTVKKNKLYNTLHFNTKTVTIKANVEKFTEGRFYIPFEVVNLPKNVQLTTLTKTVEIVYVVALSHFNAIDENSFKIECDYTISEKNNLDYLIPTLVLKPNLLKSVKIVSNKIDFLIQK